MSDLYKGREQTQAKHFILRRYLQALAFKVLSAWDTLTFVDGFSGPWESRTPDFSDTSFMIAIDVLKDAQRHFRSRNQNKSIKCFFVEKKPTAFSQLDPAVRAHHDPNNRFFVETYEGEFEHAVPTIASYVQRSFALIFIDPTGWTGFAFDKISTLLRHPHGEVLVNIMYDHINRFINSEDIEIEKSFEQILGGPGWKFRLDQELPRGQALLKLFREILKNAGGYNYATTTCIEKATADRPHYFLAYGTRKPAGLEAFREVEWLALRQHEDNRRQVKADRREQRTGMSDLFAAVQSGDDSSIESLVQKNKVDVKKQVVLTMQKHRSAVRFDVLWSRVLEAHMLRVKDVKDICVELAAEGVIESPWRAKGNRKPHDDDLIRLCNQ